jgi:putative heme-binding domain-containing protein
LRRLLTRWSGQDLPIAENAEDPWLAHAPWFDWFEQTHPEAATELSGFGAVGAVWQERLAALDWDQGDSSRGEAFFANASCARCHTGRARTGPELTNITQRLSREDLFTKIIDPHRDVSPLYQSTILITADGRVYQGQIIYESVAATLLRTGLNETIRIAGPRIVSMHPSSQSPMPSGLLDDATDRDLADLYAFLMTLTQE